MRGVKIKMSGLKEDKMRGWKWIIKGYRQADIIRWKKEETKQKMWKEWIRGRKDKLNKEWKKEWGK